MGKGGIEVFSRVLPLPTDSNQFAIFRSDQSKLPEEQQRPAVTVIHRPPTFNVTWTTHLSAMIVQREASRYLGVLHGVSVSYGQPESAPTATYTTSFDPSHIPLRPLSQLIAETTAFLGLPPIQLEEHLVKFINPQ